MNLQTTAETEASLTIQELFSLQGRVALVTGGASSFGAQISQGLAEAGARVIVASRDFATCEGFARRFEGTKFQVAPLALDLTNLRSVQEVSEQISSRWGCLDILVNNAVVGSVGPLEECTDAEWERSMRCNSLGLLRACREFSALMKQGGRGSIINIASIYGFMSPDFRIYAGHPELISSPSYAFAKGGMIQITRYLSVYLAPRGIRVNCISPGGLFSPATPPDFVEKYSYRVPMARMAGPNDLKGAVVFLASDAAGYITGQNLMVDGGLSAL